MSYYIILSMYMCTTSSPNTE